MKRSFIAIILLGAVASLSQAQQPQKTVPLTELEQSKLEATNLKYQNLQLQVQLAQKQIEATQKEFGDLVTQFREAHKLGLNALLSQDMKSLVVPAAPKPAEQPAKK